MRRLGKRGKCIGRCRSKGEEEKDGETKYMCTKQKIESVVTDCQ